MKFSNLKLSEPILQAVEEAGFTEPTPIQAEAVPAILSGSDVLGCARTGTGKTAAFALPLIQRLEESWTAPRELRVRSLILSPTRELAGQINDSIRTYGRHIGVRTAVVFGGVSIRPQITTLTRGTHILVATPGRLLDLMNQGQVHARPNSPLAQASLLQVQYLACVDGFRQHGVTAVVYHAEIRDAAGL